MEGRTVPHFASFKRQSRVEHPATDRETAEPGKAEAQERDHKKYRRDHERGQITGVNAHSHLDRHRSRPRSEGHRHRSRQRHGRQERSSSLTTNESEESEFFLIDRRGDPKNVEYGGLHRYSIPLYRQIGHGRVLGTDAGSRIDRDASDERGVVLHSHQGKGGKRGERLLVKKSLRTKSRSQRLVLPRADITNEASTLNLDDDFLALRPNLKRKRGSASPSRDEASVDYRSLEGKAKPNLNPQDEDVGWGSSSDDSDDVDADLFIRARSGELSRAAKSDPTNADAWLALVEYQAQSTFPGTSADEFTGSQRRSIAEVRSSILEQAFKHITNGNRGHDRLLLKYIDEGSKVWDATKLSRKWQDALKQGSASCVLWREYLGFLQTDPSSFRYEACKDAYLQCFETLKLASIKTDRNEQIELSNTFVYILLRFTRFTAESGYDELAIAIWQAVFEFSLFAPAGHNEDVAKLRAFEQFWESDTPRFGEEGALGWRECRDRGSTTSRRPSQYTLPTSQTAKTIAEAAVTENRLLQEFVLPATAEDEDDESEDPFRHVMFSDVTPVLERLPGQIDDKLLINAFLCFMQLPAIDTTTSAAQPWASDPFLSPSERSWRPTSPKNQRHDSFSLFYETFQDCLLDGEACNFVRRSLISLTTILPAYEELGEYLLAFLSTSKTNPDEAVKTAKRLLKSHSTSLRYYNAYALSQISNKATDRRPEKANGIWTKALELSRSLTEDARDDVILLRHSWLMTLVHQGLDHEALQTLLTAPNGSTVATDASAGAVLKARRYLEEGLDRMQLKQKPLHAMLQADCLAWLTYLASIHDIAATLQSFNKSSHLMQREHDGHALELLHQAKARLLGCHMRARRPFKPTVFRDELDISRRLFPENSAILHQLYAIRKLTRLDDRLRNALGEAQELAIGSRGLMSWLFAINSEIERSCIDGASATRDSVRALFRRALLSSDSKVKSSALLWKQWLDFESKVSEGPVSQSDSRSRDAVKKSKQVFFDGMMSLSWHNNWIIEGMALFAEHGVMTEGELRQVHDVRVGRELRVRVDVEDRGSIV